MASIVFINTVTHIPAEWANDTNTLVYGIFEGAPNKAAARTALQLGTLSTQNANSVVIEGGNIDNVNIGGSSPAVGRFSSLKMLVAPNASTDVTNKAYVDAGLAAVEALIGGAGGLNSLPDVTLNSPADGEALVYDGSASQWKNVNLNLAQYAQKSGTTFTGAVTFNAYPSTALTPTLSGHLVNKGYFDTTLNSRLLAITGNPGPLDTLIELAAAINNDPNFYVTIGTSIAGRVAKSGDTMTGALVLAADPVTGLGAATKQYVDAAIAALINSAPGLLDTLAEIAAALGNDPDFSTHILTQLSNRVQKTGDTMSGFLVLNADPTQLLHAATKQYVDAQIAASGAAGKVDRSGDTMTGFLTLAANPTNNLHAATKQYVDTNSGAVAVATHSNPSLTPNAHTAAQIVVTPAGNITTVNVANALNELDAKKITKSGDTMVDGALFSFGARAITSRARSGSTTDGGSLHLALSSSSVFSGPIRIEQYGNVSEEKLRFYEVGGTQRGAFLDFNTMAAGIATEILHTGNHIGVADPHTQYLTRVDYSLIPQGTTHNVAYFAGVTNRMAVAYNAGGTALVPGLADASSTQDIIGFADNPNNRVIYSGLLGGFGGLTPGVKYYLSTSTPGGITNVLPTSNPVLVGVAKTTTELMLNIGGGTGGGSGVSNSKSYLQTTHGFVVGNWLYHNGTQFVKARADVDATSDAVGVVTSVTDANNFVMTTHGYVTGLSGLTAGSAHWLSTLTAGALQSTAPTAAGHIDKPVFIADSATTGFVNVLRGTTVIYSKLLGAVGGGADQIFFENDQIITTDYTITAGKNAMTAGPVTINDGVTVTLNDGSTWTIVG